MFSLSGGSGTNSTTRSSEGEISPIFLSISESEPSISRLLLTTNRCCILGNSFKTRQEVCKQYSGTRKSIIERLHYSGVPRELSMSGRSKESRAVATELYDGEPAVADTSSTDHPMISQSSVSSEAVVSQTRTTDQLSTSGSRSASGKLWWLLAAVSSLLLTALTVAAVYLVTKKPSTVDQLVILTVPSGAEIRLDSRDYGHSPVKLEQLKIGTYTLTISKEGFEPIVQPISVAESGPPIEFKLKPVPPSETAGQPTDEQVTQYQQRAEEAFARGYYGLVYEGSALYYADLIRYLDSGNSFSAEMRERVRNAAHHSAQTAIARGDLAQAQEMYGFLIENYPDDDDARSSAARLENQLSARRGEVRELVRKAEEAMKAGNLTDPSRSSAYFFSKQALAIDHQNDKARQIRNQVRDSLLTSAEQSFERGESESAVKQLEQIVQKFPEDKQARTRIRDRNASRPPEPPKAADPNARRLRGLEAYQNDRFSEAIPDLEDAFFAGRSTAEVIFALARSYYKVGQLDQAESYFLRVQPSAGAAYRSAIAALGDVANQRGDTATAVARYKEARQAGGSTLYTVAELEDKIDRIERRQRQKAAEPTPLAIKAKHLHGGITRGSCDGTITINSTGIRYDGSEHTYSYTVSGVDVRITKDEMTIQFGKDAQKFRVVRADADRFQETLARYKQAYAASNN